MRGKRQRQVFKLGEVNAVGILKREFGDIFKLFDPGQIVDEARLHFGVVRKVNVGPDLIIIGTVIGWRDGGRWDGNIGGQNLGIGVGEGGHLIDVVREVVVRNRDIRIQGFFFSFVTNFNLSELFLSDPFQPNAQGVVVNPSFSVAQLGLGGRSWGGRRWGRSLTGGGRPGKRDDGGL